MEQTQKLGQEPAFPDPSRGAEQSISNQTPWENPSGMSKRFYAACAAMQGIYSGRNGRYFELNEEHAVKWAYKIADELLKQENE